MKWILLILIPLVTGCNSSPSTHTYPHNAHYGYPYVKVVKTYPAHVDFFGLKFKATTQHFMLGHSHAAERDYPRVHVPMLNGQVIDRHNNLRGRPVPTPYQQ